MTQMPPPRRAVIVAHGQPSDPLPAAADLAALAAQVQELLPDWHLGAATLAEADALARAVAGDGAGVIYPMFMAGGWFTTTNLPRKLAECGAAAGWQIAAPFGTDLAVHDLASRVVAGALADVPADKSGVIIAAHGSGRSREPARVALALADHIAATLAPARIETGFIEEPPHLADVMAGFDAHSVVLPFFAANGGHVTDDLPQAVEQVGYAGRVLPALGLHPDVPALIAAALMRHVARQPDLAAAPQ